MIAKQIHNSALYASNIEGRPKAYHKDYIHSKLDICISLQNKASIRVKNNSLLEKAKAWWNRILTFEGSVEERHLRKVLYDTD